jgi:hypothetical protein
LRHHRIDPAAVYSYPIHVPASRLTFSQRNLISAAAGKRADQQRKPRSFPRIEFRAWNDNHP